MTELEQALLKALKQQDDELKSVHARIEQQQKQINHLVKLVKQLSELSSLGSKRLDELQPILKKLAKR